MADDLDVDDLLEAPYKKEEAEVRNFFHQSNICIPRHSVNDYNEVLS